MTGARRQRGAGVDRRRLGDGDGRRPAGARPVRKGGNLGAHFDLEKEPNEETATLMIELLEYLIEYLFVLPKRIDKIHGTIDGLANN